MKLKVLVAGISTGYTFREKVHDDPEGDLWVVQMRDVYSNTPYIRRDEMIRINSNSIRSASYLQPRDILIASRGYRFQAISVGEELTQTIASSAFLVVRCNPTKLHPNYLAWYLNQPNHHQRLLSVSTTTSGLFVLRKQELENFDIQVPSIDEQQKIGQLAKLLEREAVLYYSITERRTKLINTYLHSFINSNLAETNGLV